MSEAAGPRGRGAGRAEPPPELRHLTEQLRRARERSGLSFAALGARTEYSKSSWERYLNGKALPPRHAVEVLARLGDMPAARLVALWELADRAWSGRDARPADGASHGAPPVAPDRPGNGSRREAEAAAKTEAGGAPSAGRAASEAAEPATASRRPGRCRAAAAGLLVLAVLALATAAWALATAGVGGQGGASATDPSPTPHNVPCRGNACTGLDADDPVTGCASDAGTYAREVVAGRVVELRVSPYCQAAWARLVEPREADRVWVETRAGERQEIAASAANVYMYTPMVGVSGPTGARACYALATGATGCGPWGVPLTLPPVEPG